jgi:hypothetical protein
MKTDLMQSALVYNFNADYDDYDQSYCFILMTTHRLFAYQILITYSNSTMGISVMRPNGELWSIDHGVKPIAIMLKPHEIIDAHELKLAIDDLIESYGRSPNELDDYMTANIENFLKEIIQDARRRDIL